MREQEKKRVEKEMMERARNLEFEKAAQARDRLNALKELLFGRGRDTGLAADSERG